MKFKSIIFLFVLGLVLAGCNLQSENQNGQANETAESTTANATENQDSNSADNGEAMMGDSDTADDQMMADVINMTVDMFEFGYTPEVLTAEPGQTLEITLTNSDGFHDFVIDELNVASEKTNEGEITTVTIEIPEDTESGSEFAYYCSVGSHREMGMEGVLVIE